jgi:hypothetical protein
MNTLKALVAAIGVAALSTPALAENCADTTFSALPSIGCAGSFVGNINGSTSETTFLNTEFGGSFTYVGKSDDAGNGPFTSNPQVSTAGTLTFDSPLTGTFVIGLKAANNFSYYLFNALLPVSSLTFDSTAGVALNGQGIAQNLSHAALYVTAAVPEPETYALMVAGLAAMGFMARRRQAG